MTDEKKKIMIKNQKEKKGREQIGWTSRQTEQQSQTKLKPEQGHHNKLLL